MKTNDNNTKWVGTSLLCAFGAKKERLTAISLLHKSTLALLAEGKPAASDWLAEHPKAFTLSVTETWQMVNQTYERFVTQGSCC